MNSLDNRLFACGVFVGSQKAFDTVDHNILLKKLEYYGIRGIANNWFRSYLENRNQFVSINGFEGGQMPIYRRLPKRGFNNPFKIKTQSINFTMINNIIKKYNLDPTQIKEDELFNKKIFKRSKGSLKLLSVGKPENITNLEISFASKKAIELIEKLGGKIKLTKK